jgi:predicted nucleotidyltransferase component of viral defense system
LGLVHVPFSIENSWFSGGCELTTYVLEELLGTKLRALYQRKKGRDLFDLYKALSIREIEIEKVIRCYRRYMNFVVSNLPTHKQFIQNMESKMNDPDFLEDMENLLCSDETYDTQEAFQIVKEKIINRLTM